MIGNTSADAAGLPLLPLLLRPDEGLPTSLGGQGEIDHALRFTLASGFIEDSTYAYPASHPTVGGDAGSLAYIGMRLRLKPSFDISSLPGAAQVVARALQQYGMILADRGGNFLLNATADAVDANNNKVLTWTSVNTPGPNTYDLIYGILQKINISDFQVVDLTPQVSSLSEPQGNPGDNLVISGVNFSGAGGRISVLFGNASSPNVSVINDTTLVAQVPFGSGTVGVRVQAGVALSPQNLAYATGLTTGNVWGYGISAQSLPFSYRNASPSPVNSPLGFTTPDGVLHWFFRETDGTLLETIETGIGATTLVPVKGVSGTLPVPAGSLDAFVQIDDGVPIEHLLYRDSNGHIQDLVKVSSTGLWMARDLTPQGGIVGDPLALNGGNLWYVIYRTTDGPLEAFTLPSGAGPGPQVLFGSLTGPPPLIASDPVGVTVPYQDATGQTLYALHVIFRDDFGRLHDLYLAPGSGWQVQSLAGVQGLNNTAVGTPSVSVSGTDVFLAYRNQDNVVQEMHWSVASPQWALVALPASFANASLRAYSDPQVFAFNGQQSLLYFGSTGGLIDLSDSPQNGWVTQQSASSPGLPPIHGAGVPLLLVGGSTEFITVNDAAARLWIELASSGGGTTFGILGKQAPALRSAPAARGPTGSQNQEIVHLSWTGVVNATRYQVLLVDTTANVSSASVTGLTGTTWTTGALTPGHGYQWRVRAINLSGPGAWSATATFSIAPVSAPALTDPTLSAATNQMTFTWAAVPNAVAYVVSLVDRTSALVGPIHVIVTGTTWVSPPLVYRHRYQWRIQAISNKGTLGPWSSPYEFVVG
jgi:hypothetical protein